MKSQILIISSIIFSSQLLSTEMNPPGNPFKKRTDASKCSTVDMRGPKLGPVRNQDTVGWCFAYTAADLVSYRLGKRVSGADMSMSFYNQMPEMPKHDPLSGAGGGDPLGALSKMNPDGFCLESDFPSEDYNIPKNCGPTTAPLLADILKKFEKLHKEKPASISVCELGGIPSLFKGVSLEVIQKAILDTGKTSLEAIVDLQEKACKGKRIKQKMKMRGTFADGVPNILKDLDKQLDKDNPVSYNYDAGFLLPEKPAEIANHYSSIVGRRFDEKSGSCQYLIRNSWGRNCSQFPKPYDTQCEEGNIWVNEEVIGKNLIGMHYLD